MYPVRAVKGIDQDTVGDSVCWSVPFEVAGTLREGSKCGFILSKVIAEEGRTDGTEILNGRMVEAIPASSNTPVLQPGDSGGPVFSNAPNTARGSINGIVQDIAGQPTHYFTYSQIGYVNAYSRAGEDLRILTAPGPGGGTP